MKFVTKKEFEGAVEVLKLAIKNGQVQYGRYDAKDNIDGDLCFSTMPYGSYVDVDHTSFVSPFEAANAQLIAVRDRLNKQKSKVNKESKDLEELEAKERQLARIVPTLKE